MFERTDQLARKYAGVSAVWVAALVAAPSVMGALVGWIFPVFDATAVLQFPEASNETSVIDLQMYKRIAVSYNSSGSIAAYLEGNGERESAATHWLLRQSKKPGFWDKLASPLLPYSKRDQREFGDIKDAANTTLLGIQLTASARSPEIAAQSVALLANYITDAVVRERVRTWVLKEKAQHVASDKSLRADIVRAELDMELAASRIKDMRAILTRYPEATRLEFPQLLNINGIEDAERFLSPFAQLVGAESAISRLRERIRRLGRELQQGQLISPFYSRAEQVISGQPSANKLLAELDELARQVFANADAKEEWAREVTLRLAGTLGEFAVMWSQIGIRTVVRTDAAPYRDPLSLALFGGAAGAGVILLAAFLRRAPEQEEAEDAPRGAGSA